MQRKTAHTRIHTCMYHTCKHTCMYTEDPSDSCPASPAQPGPISWTTWIWPEAAQRDSTWSHATLRTTPHAKQHLAQIKSKNKVSKTSPAHNKLNAAASRMLAQGKQSQSVSQVKDKRPGWLRQRLAGGKLHAHRASRAALLVASQAYDPKNERWR